MTMKKSRSRLGTDIPAMRGMSAFFGNVVEEKAAEIENEALQEVSKITEISRVTQIPEPTATEGTPGTKVIAATNAIPVTLPATPNVVSTPPTTKVAQKKKVKKKPTAPVISVAAGGTEFTPTRGLPPGWERHTYVIQTKHVNMIESAAYWDRLDKKDILQAALDLFFKGRKLKPLPPEKRRERKARNSTKK